jgi:dinuclear metal center YbgI/SA1388 family protein
MVRLKYILSALEARMPRSLAEDYDNVGLLAGSRDRAVFRVLCALDLTEAVLDEAEDSRAELILTHHPILFHSRRNLTEDDPEGKLLARLVRARKCLIAMHTNYDAALCGVGDALAGALGLSGVLPLEAGVRIGSVRPMPLYAFADRVSENLGGVVRRYGKPEIIVSRVAVLGGAGGSYADIARRAGADTFVTGEIGYHRALSALDSGMCALEAGHAATERPAVRHLTGILQSAGLDIEITESAIEPFL